MTLPSFSQARQLALVILASTLSGYLAWQVGLPLPFMMGGLAATLVLVSFRTRALDESKAPSGTTAKNNQAQPFYFPKLLRMSFVGMIGVLIGNSFTSEALNLIPSLGISLLAMPAYVVTAHAIGFFLVRKLGGFDRVTSFYAAMPGGLIEAVLLGERHGGDVRVLTLIHFIRVFLVVTLVPWFFYFTSGSAVGSAAGQSFSNAPSQPIDIILICLMTAAGLFIGRLTRLPASHLMGPMILSGGLHAFGVVQAPGPEWLLFTAQLFVGIGLGSQFTGKLGPLLYRVAGLTLITVACFLAWSALFAFGVSRLTDLPPAAVFLAFAPGGVTEMGLIALSLSLSPVLVAVHHIFRIFVTVGIAAISSRFFSNP